MDTNAVRPAGAPASRLISIQYLRAAAAMLVIVYHLAHQLRGFGYDGPWPDWTKFGVDIFFVISGVVMWLTTCGRETSTGAFYLRRVLRIVPLYYLLTTLMVIALLAVPAAVRSGRFDAVHVLASYLFLPVGHPVLAKAVPVLIPGWTLNCEMLFYLVFGLMLPLREGPRLVGTLAALGLIVVAALSVPAESAAAQLYGSSLLLEFGLGLGLGKLLAEGWAWPPRPAWFAVVLGALALTNPLGIDDPRVIVAGLPALAIVAGLVSLERQGRLAVNPVLVFLGDASYSLYLSHEIVLSASAQVALRLGLGRWRWGAAAYVPLGVGAALAAAALLYLCAERPMLRALTRREVAEPRLA